AVCVDKLPKTRRIASERALHQGQVSRFLDTFRFEEQKRQPPQQARARIAWRPPAESRFQPERSQCDEPIFQELGLRTKVYARARVIGDRGERDAAAMSLQP